MRKCSICGRPFNGFGNNPEPIRRWIDGACCNECNETKVVPARMNGWREVKDEGR